MSRLDADACHCQGGDLGWRWQVWVHCPWTPMKRRLFLGVLLFWGVPTAQSLVEAQEQQQSQFHSPERSPDTHGRLGGRKNALPELHEVEKLRLAHLSKKMTHCWRKKQSKLCCSRPPHSVCHLSLSWVPSPLLHSHGDPTASTLSHPSQGKELQPRDSGLGMGTTPSLGDHSATSAGSRDAPSPRLKAELGMQRFLAAGRD